MSDRKTLQIAAEQHEKIKLAALLSKKSLYQWITEAIEAKLAKTAKRKGVENATV